MFSFYEGKPIADIVDYDGSDDGEILHIDTNANDEYDNESASYDGKEYELVGKGRLIPLVNLDERSIEYIAGPSGSGKSTLAAELAESWKELYPDKDIFFLSRTNYRDDPAFKNLVMRQITINESLLVDPIDITKEVHDTTMIIFDDVTTIPDDKIKKSVEKLMSDIMEIGRKLKIWIIITSHLVIGNDKKLARTIMNELQSLYIFPKSGSAQQISYSLKTYFGLSKKQIEKLLHLPSRWVKVSKSYPQYVMWERGAYIL